MIVVDNASRIFPAMMAEEFPLVVLLAENMAHSYSVGFRPPGPNRWIMTPDLDPLQFSVGNRRCRIYQ
jgi:hypothetical protein